MQGGPGNSGGAHAVGGVAASAGEAHGRVGWIDAAKGIGILLMTFGHVAEAPGGGWMLPALEVATAWVYLFHMPAFFLLGGLTYRRGQPWRSFVVKKLRTLLVPYVVWSLYFPAKAVALAGADGAVAAAVASLVDVYVFGHGLWFLAAYLVGELLAFALMDVARIKGAALGLVGVALYVLSYVWFALVVGAGLGDVPFQLLNGLRAAGLMCLGAWARPLVPPVASHRRGAYVASLLVACVPFVWSGWLSIGGGASELGWLPAAVAALSGSVMMALLALLLSSCDWLERIGRVSLRYYVVAPEATNLVKLPLLLALRAFMPGGGGVGPALGQWALALAMTVAILALSRPITHLIRRHLPWTIGLTCGRTSPADPSA